MVQGYLRYAILIWFGFVSQCSWEASGFGIQLSLANGGPASLLYGTLIAGIGSALIALSLGEMAALDPEVGAQYRWSARFAPMWPRFWGLLQGWITVFAWIACATANPVYLALGIQSLVLLNYPEYEPQAYHATLLMCATVIPAVGVNLWLRRIIKPLEWFGAVAHGVFWVVSMITLGVMGSKSSNASVWASLTSGLDGGWTSPGMAFGVGLLPVTFPLTAFDGVIHMSKEVIDPRRNVPRSMIFSVALNAIMQFVWFLVVLYYGFNDPVAIASAPLGLAIVGVYLSATGSKAATNVLVSFHLVILFGSFFNILASTSRLTWAFSQNKGLPFSRFLGRVSFGFPLIRDLLRAINNIQVSSRFNQPVWTLVLVAVICCLLSTINIGSTAALNAFISLPLIALYLSYLIPICFFLFARSRGRISLSESFDLGYYPGFVVNMVAIAYIVYVLSFAALPTSFPVTAANMNYSGPLMLVVIAIAVVGWGMYGSQRFVIEAGTGDGGACARSTEGQGSRLAPSRTQSVLSAMPL